MFYYRSNLADCYIVIDTRNILRTYGSLTQLRLDWPFAKRINVH